MINFYQGDYDAYFIFILFHDVIKKIKNTIDCLQEISTSMRWIFFLQGGMLSDRFAVQPLKALHVSEIVRNALLSIKLFYIKEEDLELHFSYSSEEE